MNLRTRTCRFSGRLSGWRRELISRRAGHHWPGVAALVVGQVHPGQKNGKLLMSHHLHMIIGATGGTHGLVSGVLGSYRKAGNEAERRVCVAVGALFAALGGVILLLAW